MAGRDQIAKDIEQFLETNWVTTNIQFENVDPIDPDDATKLLSEGTTPYIFVAIQFAESNAAEVGGVLRRSHGIVYVEIRVKDGTGTRLANSYIATLQTLLEYKDISDVKLRGSSTIAGFSSGGWYILPVSFNFRYDRQE